ncbi:MAG TPA: SDR family oxidoreductase [Stellaceae bacterium]
MAGIGKDLTGKVAVVTGASSGIGAASARLFAEAGARVVVGYNRGVDRATAVVAGLAGKGHKPVRLPLEDTVEINRVAAWVKDEFGRADILVNSAGFTQMVAHNNLDGLTDELVDSVLTANVRGPLATIRAFAPMLKASGDGVVVNISSGAGERGTGSSMIYGASKAALNTLSMSLARVLAPEVRVVVVSPGMVHTDFVPGRTEEMMLKVAMASPLKKQIEAEDVALAVLSCVTHLSFTTGSIIAVNGGGHL